jgi:DNA-binding CsgD family transcriptional regulator
VPSRCGTTRRAELLAAGARPRRTALTGPDALTSAERQVAELAADGLSNRQIAQHLFITQATVETHLRHTFNKLGHLISRGPPPPSWPAPPRERGEPAASTRGGSAHRQAGRDGCR